MATGDRATARVPRRPPRSRAVAEEDDIASSPDWSVMVRVMGPPDAVIRSGEKVTFRKGRALELLCWLTLNRERMSRSMARTAMWESDVADATFSTVVSEMRRAVMHRCADLRSGSVSSPTYTDEVRLDPRIVSDYDALRRAHDGFTGDEESAAAVMRCLRLVRGVPFSGARYAWPDLDGTTTRIAVTILDASLVATEWALDRRRRDVAVDALAAGMRVFPGHPDLLVLERRMLTQRRFSDS